MNDAERKMIDLFRACLSLEIQDAEIPKLSRSSCPTWDSMGHLNLILAAEETFQVSIPEEQGAGVASFAEMTALVNRLQAS